MHEEMDGKQDVCLFEGCFSVASSMLLDAFLETRPLLIPWSLHFIRGQQASNMHPTIKVIFSDMAMNSFMSARTAATKRARHRSAMSILATEAVPQTPAPDGCKHQAYMVYNGADLVWARRLQFHLRRFSA